FTSNDVSSRSYLLSIILLLPPPTSTLFPTRRSSDLVEPRIGADLELQEVDSHEGRVTETDFDPDPILQEVHARTWETHGLLEGSDRKSTRLNSSHRTISYAVFCLKKKKKKNNIERNI